MTDKGSRSPEVPHKKGPDRHDPAIKHDKEPGGRRHSRDVHEDRGVRKSKLGRPKR